MINQRKLFEVNKDNSKEIEKLKMDLDYYKNILKENNSSCNNEYTNIISNIENLIKKYDNGPKLEPGDYLSFPSDGEGYILTQIVKVGHSYMLMNVDTFKNQFGTLYTLSQIKDMVKNANDDVYPYYVDHEYKAIIGDEDFSTTSCEYLVYDKDCGGDFEVSIIYDTPMDKYYIMTSSLDDYFYEEGFNFAYEASMRLYQDYKIVKKLRD